MNRKLNRSIVRAVGTQQRRRCTLFTCAEHNTRKRFAKMLAPIGRICKRRSRQTGKETTIPKVWIRGAYLRDITRQIAISCADLHRTCCDILPPNGLYACARAFSRKAKYPRNATFLITIRRQFQMLQEVRQWLVFLNQRSSGTNYQRQFLDKSEPAFTGRLIILPIIDL